MPPITCKREHDMALLYKWVDISSNPSIHQDMFLRLILEKKSMIDMVVFSVGWPGKGPYWQQASSFSGGHLGNWWWLSMPALWHVMLRCWLLDSAGTVSCQVVSMRQFYTLWLNRDVVDISWCWCWDLSKQIMNQPNIIDVPLAAGQILEQQAVWIQHVNPARKNPTFHPLKRTLGQLKCYPLVI